MFEINDEQNFCLTARETLGDVAAPVNRTKGPVCAADQGGILHGNEIVKESLI